MNVKKVVVNGVAYIGKLGKVGDIHMLEQAMVFDGTIDRATIGEYFKRKNLRELEVIEFGGKSISYSVRNFTSKEKRIWRIAKIAMTEAKDKAALSLENSIFDDVLGKL